MLKLTYLHDRYRSVRLDSVHYCEREIDLAAKRKRRSFFERNGDPKDPTEQRMLLFNRTVREAPDLAALVHILKMPYMTRETCKVNLARIVSVLPNLRYVDLPEGFYSDDPACSPLRQEIQHRCPEIRKTRYIKGSEESFSMLAQEPTWQNMEVLELSGLQVELDILLYVLSSFTSLQSLTLGDIPSLDDSLFHLDPSMPLFPPLKCLTLDVAPSITSAGLMAYLSRSETRAVLTELCLFQTGIPPQELYGILSHTPQLTALRVRDMISRALPLAPLPHLASKSLRTLHFEILPSNPSHEAPSETYYSYLATSILSGSLPSLTDVFAFSLSLPELLLSPPVAPFTGPTKPRFSTVPPMRDPGPPTTTKPRFTPLPLSPLRTTFQSLNFPNQNVSPLTGIKVPLSIYTKSLAAPELEWNLTTIDPPSERNGRRGSASTTRPISLAMWEKAPASPTWSARSRDSVLVGNGFGGFLVVPEEDGGSANGTRRSSPMSPPTRLQLSPLSRGGGGYDADWMG